MTNMTIIDDWVWDLVIAIEKHEEEHEQGAPCLADAFEAIPSEVRATARVISHREYRKSKDKDL